MQEKYFEKIGELLNIPVKQVRAVYILQEGGATVPFMARYRKEATGNLDEVLIEAIVEHILSFADLEKRKVAISKMLEAEGKLSLQLKDRLDSCFSSAALEDIYLPYKKGRKTRASKAVENGLEPLAHFIFSGKEITAEQEATTFLNDQVKTTDEALAGARDIVAEWISVHDDARKITRQLFAASAMVVSRVIPAKKEDESAQKYRDYFAFSEPLKNCPSHRILAIRRGEKEGILLMDISIEKEPAIHALDKLFNDRNAPLPQLFRAVEDGYSRLLKPSIENEFRLLSKNKADDDAIQVFSGNLRQLLLAAPLGAKKVLALDPGYRTGCKLVCLDAQGALVHNTTIYPHAPQNALTESREKLIKLVAAYNIEAIAIGNGTAGRETETFVRDIDFGATIEIFLVNESGASIYSASEAGREEFPDHDLTVRGAVSIGRRLLDPLSELVKIDPKAIGVGQYQHDVNSVKLQAALDRVVESAVNFVGVDVNRASKQLLQYVSGISASLAGNIVQYRSTIGSYRSREDLKKIPLMGAKSFEQCAGFLRIPGAGNVLDTSSVHPERYALVTQMAKDAGASVNDLVQQSELRKGIKKTQYINELAGAYTIQDILEELEKPGRDPRSVAEEFKFSNLINTIEDVKTGMRVPGIVTNITGFGAFVNIGVKSDGLVHLSQLADQFVQDPSQVVQLGQHVMVTITGVNLARKRIELSMKTGEPQLRAPTKEKMLVKKSHPPAPDHTSDFESGLLKLQKKFRPK
ncbi:MAG: Tex family protein [Chitinophagaceae bacterium]